MAEVMTVAGIPVSRFAECPKGMSNGPCAGVRSGGGCEVHPAVACIWWQAAVRAPDEMLRLRPPAEWSKDGEPDWASVFAGGGRPILAAIREMPDKAARSPRSAGRLEQALREGRFVVTAQVDPPDGPQPQPMLERLQTLRGRVDAVHVTDNAHAAPRLGALAFAGLLERVGLETVMHLSCRDRNRLMLQADLLGAAALGVKNVLCITGEHPRTGAHFESKPVFDLDSISLLALARTLRDEAKLWNGRLLEQAPRLFLGAGAEMSEPFEYRPRRLAVKVAAGCDFAVSEALTRLGRFPEYLHRVRDLGLDRHLYLLATIAMPADQPEAAAADQCARLIEQVRELPGVAGVTLAAHSPEQVLTVMKLSELTPAAAS